MTLGVYPVETVAIVTALQLMMGPTGLVFGSQRKLGQPLSNNTVRAAPMRVGFAGEMTAHGLRASARMLGVERLGTPVEVLELQITHKVADARSGLQPYVVPIRACPLYAGVVRLHGYPPAWRKVLPLVRAA